jgi:mevalonate pyrophosphate decarboxylase
VFIAFVICKILKFYNKDRIKYANVLRADEQIREKIETANKQLGELKTTTNMSTSPEAKKMYKERIKEMEEMIRKLGEIHDELQAQKIIMNASLSTKELKNVSLKDNKSVNKAIDRERDKISAFHNINDSLGDVDDIMKKYKI